MRIRIVSLILALAAMLTQAALSTLPASAATTPKPLAARHTLANAELNKVTLDEESIDGPALWSTTVNQIGYMGALAWTGIDSIHSLNVMTAQGTVQFANKLTLDEQSIARPAVDQIGKIVVLAWTGTDPRHSLNIMWDVYGQRQKITMGDNSNAGPALVDFGNSLWLAWCGTDPNHLLNVRRFSYGTGGIAVGPAVTLPQYDCKGGPVLGVDFGHHQLLLTWTDTGQSSYLPNALTYINFLASSDGANWHTVLVAPPPQTSIAAPGITQLQPLGVYYWTWTGTDPAHSLNLAATSTVDNWPAPIVTYDEQCLGGPSVGYAGSSEGIVIVWTGVDPLHHINIGFFQH